ncbi:MAG TPA: class I SAM-dependent methyltransferase [Rhodopila sp.]
MTTTAQLYSGKDGTYFAHPRTDIEPLLPANLSRALEIGCGSGATMRWLRDTRRIEYAAGIELVPEMASQAAAVFEQIMVGGVETLILEVPPRSFDLILALDILEHLVDPWEVVRSCMHALKPGGALIASIPNVGHYSVAFPLIFRGDWRYQDEGLLDRTHLRFFVARTAIELMTSSGCVLEHIEKVRAPPSLLSRIPARFGGTHLRWYATRLMNWLPDWTLFDYRYIIRVRAPGQEPG